MAIQNETYDVIITGDRVMDPETELDDVRNVGVKDGKIVAITIFSIRGRLSL
jgi:N-acyl-D-aspartate/D-glutamate deacylase